MESKAVSRYIHQSPHKMRKALNSVRGLKVGDKVGISINIKCIRSVNTRSFDETYEFRFGDT